MKLYPDDWRFRLTVGLVTMACLGAVFGLGPSVGINGFWPFMLAIVAASFGGHVLGVQVARLLFGPSAGRPPEHPPHA